MKSLRFSAFLFILGCISMFVACNKEVASELPKQKVTEIVVEGRAASDVVFEDVWANAVTRQITPNNPNASPKFPVEYIGKNRPAGSVPMKSTFKTGMKWRIDSHKSIIFLPNDAGGRLGQRIEEATAIGRPSDNTILNRRTPEILGNNWQAHHIIPIGTNNTHPMVIEAAKQGFHLNEYYNGIWLPNKIRSATFHASNSNKYIDYINFLMQTYYTRIETIVKARKINRKPISVEQMDMDIRQECYKCLVDGIIPKIRTQIEFLLLESQKKGGDATLRPSQYEWSNLGIMLSGYTITK